MNKKLTLLLDETVIDQAKHYAGRRKETLSGMVERYFKFLTAKKRGRVRPAVSPGVGRLVGIIRLPEDLDVKREYRRSRAAWALRD